MRRGGAGATTGLISVAGAGLLTASHYPALLYIIVGAGILMLSVIAGAAVFSRRRVRRDAAFAVLALVSGLVRRSTREPTG